MSALSTLGRSLRSVADAVVARIRRHLPALGSPGAEDARGPPVEEVETDPRGPTAGDRGGITRQSTRGSSPTALENPAEFEDVSIDGRGPVDGGDRQDPGFPTPDGTGDRVATGPDRMDGLDDRERPLSDPADGESNDTRTEGERRPDGRYRIADPDNPDAYVEGDASVVLDHVR